MTTEAFPVLVYVFEQTTGWKRNLKKNKTKPTNIRKTSGMHGNNKTVTV